MRLPRILAGDRDACAGGRPRPMAGRGRPYRYTSAVVKSNRPVGIAMMALLRKNLQYTPRRITNHATAAASSPHGGNISRIRGSATMPG